MNTEVILTKMNFKPTTQGMPNSRCFQWRSRFLLCYRLIGEPAIYENMSMKNENLIDLTVNERWPHEVVLYTEGFTVWRWTIVAIEYLLAKYTHWVLKM